MGKYDPFPSSDVFFGEESRNRVGVLGGLGGGPALSAHRRNWESLLGGDNSRYPRLSAGRRKGNFVATEIVWNGGKMTAAVRQAGIAALSKVGRRIISSAKRKAPYDTGRLAASGGYSVTGRYRQGGTRGINVDSPSLSTAMPDVTYKSGTGGRQHVMALSLYFTAPYAWKQHRDHQSRSLFLTKAVNENRRKTKRILDSEISRGLKRAGNTAMWMKGGALRPTGPGGHGARRTYGSQGKTEAQRLAALFSDDYY